MSKGVVRKVIMIIITRCFAIPPVIRSVSLLSKRAIIQSRAMSSAAPAGGFLINESKYSWLKELGLQEHNPGVYDGFKWCGSGEVSLQIT